MTFQQRPKDDEGMCLVDIWGSNNADVTNGSQYKRPKTEACLEYSRNMKELLQLRKRERARGNHRNGCQEIMEKLDFIGLCGPLEVFYSKLERHLRVLSRGITF